MSSAGWWLQARSTAEIPEEWLKAVAEKFLTPEEMEAIKSLGDWDEIMETLKQRLEEQKGRHQGGNKWIGTGGTSPFGNGGYNPEGVRIGGTSQHKRAIKVWEKREFRNLDSSVELGTRNIKVALRRLRRFAREGAAEELDIDATIDGTARKGYLDINMRAERRNAVKLLLFLDVGGSMDPHVKVCEELFSAATTEFKHLEFFYFHNCVYEGVWKDNRRRFAERTPMWDVLHKFGHDYKLLFVGDAQMSPYEISHPGGSVEHMNDESGALWLQRMTGRLCVGGVAQSGARAAMGLFAIDADDPRADRRPDVPDDAAGARRRGAVARAQTLNVTHRRQRVLAICATLRYARRHDHQRSLPRQRRRRTCGRGQDQPPQPQGDARALGDDVGRDGARRRRDGRARLGQSRGEDGGGALTA